MQFLGTNAAYPEESGAPEHKWFYRDPFIKSSLYSHQPTKENANNWLCSLNEDPGKLNFPDQYFLIVYSFPFEEGYKLGIYLNSTDLFLSEYPDQLYRCEHGETVLISGKFF